MWKFVFAPQARASAFKSFHLLLSLLGDWEFWRLGSLNMLYSYGYCYFPQRRRAAEDCVAARRELKAFYFNGILMSKCLATQKTFSCVFVLFVVSKNPESPPCLRSLYSPCFAEGHSGSDKSLIRVPTHPCKFVRICVRAAGTSDSDQSVYVMHVTPKGCVKDSPL